MGAVRGEEEEEAASDEGGVRADMAVVVLIERSSGRCFGRCFERRRELVGLRVWFRARSINRIETGFSIQREGEREFV